MSPFGLGTVSSMDYGQEHGAKSRPVFSSTHWTWSKSHLVGL